MNYFQGAVFVPHPPIIIPEVGEGRERAAKATIDGMHEVAKAVSKIKPEVIICITPHGTVFDDGVCIIDEPTISGDLSQFGFQNLTIKKEINQELTHELCNLLEEVDISHIAMTKKLSKKFGVNVFLDHGCFVPLYYIDKEYTDYKILHITIGYTSIVEHYEIGMAIRKALNNCQKRGLILGSGDLSHALSNSGPYKYNENGPLFDKLIIKHLEEGNFNEILKLSPDLVENAATCAFRPFIMMAGAFDSFDVESKLFSYEGPFGVGYATGLIRPKINCERKSHMEDYLEFIMKEQAQRLLKEDNYIKLARETIYNYIKNQSKLNFSEYKNEILKSYTIKQKLFKKEAEDFIKEVEETKSGCFVSLHANGQLRGCIGTILSTADNLAEEIIYNAISACSRDNRFSPVALKELPFIEISVDILSEPIKINSIDELDVNEFGIIVTSGNKRGVLLPKLEQITTVANQIEIAKKKAGIKDNETFYIEKFKVVRHEV